ncbi:MAG: acyl-ACP thioesterase [Desulfuromonadales bacterium]|nr:acyl-ACP thioesterase [Desulfuromonadales bacterium]
MQKTLTREYSLRIDEADWTGRARPVSLLNVLQDAAFVHATALGVGVEELMRRNMTWVLSRYRVRFLAYPPVHGRLQVVTWPSSREGRSTTRDFEIRSTGGELLAVATSAWALLDLQSRRPLRLDEILPDYPLESRRALEFSPERQPLPERSDRELPFRVRLGDLDINRHVNNTIYLQWALETVPPEVAESLRPQEIEISYRAEARYGDTVLSRLARGESGSDFLHQLLSQESGREFARLHTAWRNFPA